MQKSPFKFLDSFTKDDRDIFFGRDKEIEELHSRVFESKILLVYGTSGTGKSSLINCGLANRISDADWLPVSIRRGNDINFSLIDALSKNALTKAPFEKALRSERISYNLEKLLRSVYLDHFKPVFMIFDQFEELFIFGSKEEKNELILNIARVIDSDIQCRFIFSLREEYLAGVTEFEKLIPSFLSNRIRIEKMTRQNAILTIEGPCRVNNIEIEPGFAEALLEKLNPDSPEVELTWLQVFLDKIMRLSAREDHIVKKITGDLLSGLGDVKDILGGFLEEQISQLSEPETGLVILKSFVSVKGTKASITEDEVIEYTGTFGKKIDNEVIKELIQKFIGLRILRDKDENGKYELRHDSLASKIFEKITLVEKELLEIKYFIENAFANYEKRQLLLSEDDLKYIAPYEDKLFLNEKHLTFISQSKREFHKARRRRQNILLAAAAIIFTLLSFFTIWAMKERGNAITQKQVAETQKNEAVKAKEEADEARQDAVISRVKAEENEKLALEARNQSEISRREAVSAKENALREKSKAEALTIIADKEARNAEREKQAADEQKLLAQAAEEKATRLSLLSIAQNLALKSMIMEKNPELMGLGAVQAYNFNKTYGGAAYDPVIWEALDKAYAKLDSSEHTLFRGAVHEVRTLAENDKGLISADMDGIILQWNSEGKSESIPNQSLQSYINFINLNPEGNLIITGYENNKLILSTFNSETPEFTELEGHNGQVRIAAWSNDGNYLVTAGNDSLIIIYNIGDTKGSAYKIIKTQSAVRSMVLCSRDTIISAHEDGSVFLWNISKPSNELLFHSESEQPFCLAWNKIKNTLIAGCSNGTILLIDLAKENNQRISRYSSHSTGIDQVCFSPDFTMLGTSGWDKTIRLYRYHEFFELSNTIGGAITLKNLNARARSLIFTGNNKLVAGMSDNTIRLWETSSKNITSLICGLVKRNMTPEEWTNIVGDIKYESTCGINP